MKAGFKVWDTDTHIHPTNETLDPYYDPSFRHRLPELQKYAEPVRVDPTWTPQEVPGRHKYNLPGRMSYQRILGQAEPPEKPLRNQGKFMGTVMPQPGVADDLIDLRIQEMDREGVDVQLLVPGVDTTVFTMNDPELETGLTRAHNRFIDDLAARHPGRTKSLLPVSGNIVEQSVEEINRWGKSRWCAGIWPISGTLASGKERPLDHPDLEPIWKAAADHDLCVVHHSLAWTPPYFPGYRDVWDNNFLGRSSSHPWGAMRAVASFIGGGIMDRYPALRFAILESGCGWLPFWARRLDDQAEYVGTIAPLKCQVSEYMTSGRFFSSIEMHEGGDMIKMVTDFLGEEVLMYASDYPHPECLFPGSVDHFLDWLWLNDEQKRKILWDNPVRLYGEP